MNPIWKDYFVEFHDKEVISYRIYCEDDLVYSGKAYRRPGEMSVSVKLNEVCADYMLNVLPDMQSEFTGIGYPEFKVYNEEEKTGEWVLAHQVQFTNDWSFDYDFNPAKEGLAFPINGRVSPNQWIIYSDYKPAAITAVLRFKDGKTLTYNVKIGIAGDFNMDFNSDFARVVNANMSGTAVFKPDLTNVDTITIGNRVYKVADNCSRYVLYYCNAHGGWDSLLVEGNHAEVDEVTRYTRELSYDNRNVQNRGRVNYANEITKRMTLHSSWLLGDESSRMHHLLNATEVYLYDTQTDKMIPVLLTNSETEYKTYKGNGGQLVNYAIEVEFANRRVRR